MPILIRLITYCGLLLLFSIIFYLLDSSFLTPIHYNARIINKEYSLENYQYLVTGNETTSSLGDVPSSMSVDARIDESGIVIRCEISKDKYATIRKGDLVTIGVVTGRLISLQHCKSLQKNMK